MNFDYLFLVLSFSASIFSALFCLVLIALKLIYSRLDFFSKRLSTLLIIFYFISISYNTTLLFYVFDFKLYKGFRGVNFQLALLLPVLFYHIIFKLSRLKKDERFKYQHYLVCFLVGLFYFIYAEIIFPLDYHASSENDLKNMFFFDNGRILAKMMFNTFYLGFALYRLIRYRRNISHYSSDESRKSLRWLYAIFILVFLLYPGPIFFYALPDIKHSLIFGQLIPNFLFMFFSISLCYNIFSQNFTLVYEDIIEDKKTFDHKKEAPINKAEFEHYLKTHKPYLNPQLKITDLLTDLMTNRTYLSSFINTTYKMNFSQFINKYRYNEYLELKKSTDLSKESEVDLILASGFTSFESFKRTASQYYKNQDQLSAG